MPQLLNETPKNDVLSDILTGGTEEPLETATPSEPQKERKKLKIQEKEEDLKEEKTLISFYLSEETSTKIEDLQYQLRKSAPKELKTKINRSALGEELIKQGIIYFTKPENHKKLLDMLVKSKS